MNYSLSIDCLRDRDIIPFEVRCPWRNFIPYLNFFKEHPQIRCNLLFDEQYFSERHGELFDKVKLFCPNYTICCKDFVVMTYLINRGYNAYFYYSVNDWESFNALMEHGVSDIKIDGDLGFQIDKIRQVKGTTQIRVSPNKSSNAVLQREFSLEGNHFLSNVKITNFFIRPEDIPLYEDVDIISFDEELMPDRELVLYNIYSRNFYSGNLNFLIEGIQDEVKNDFIPPHFGKKRLKCGHVCQIPGNKCKHCQNCILTAKSMERVIET